MARRGVTGDRIDLTAQGVQPVEIIFQPGAPATDQADGPFDAARDDIGPFQRPAGRLDPVRLGHGIAICGQKDPLVDRPHGIEAHRHRLAPRTARIRLCLRELPDANIEAEPVARVQKHRLAFIGTPIEERTDRETLHAHGLDGQRIEQARQALGFVTHGYADGDRPLRSRHSVHLEKLTGSMLRQPQRVWFVPPLLPLPRREPTAP